MRRQESPSTFEIVHGRQASHRALATIAAIQYVERVADVDKSIDRGEGEGSGDDVSVDRSRLSSQQWKHKLIPPRTSSRPRSGDPIISAKQQQSAVSKSHQAVDKILLGREDVITGHGGRNVGMKRVDALIQMYATQSSLLCVKEVTVRIKRDIKPGRFLHKCDNVWCLSTDDEISRKIEAALTRMKCFLKKGQRCFPRRWTKSGQRPVPTFLLVIQNVNLRGFPDKATTLLHQRRLLRRP